MTIRKRLWPLLAVAALALALVTGVFAGTQAEHSTGMDMHISRLPRPGLRC